jgi:hypothetical protein
LEYNSKPRSPISQNQQLKWKGDLLFHTEPRARRILGRQEPKQETGPKAWTRDSKQQVVVIGKTTTYMKRKLIYRKK